MKSTIGIIGSGVVGKALAAGLARKEYRVTIASRSAATRSLLAEELGSNIKVTEPARAVPESEIIVLAVKGTAAEEAVKTLGAEALAGKIVLDTTNPIADGPHVNGVLQFFTGPNDSLMERLQRLAPQAHFVKCFSCVGNAHMVDPKFSQGMPTMFICGNDADAKKKTVALLAEIGWEAADMGAVEAARAIEPLCQLWCIPGFRESSWNHAFKLLRG